jgi:hypothetical protein
LKASSASGSKEEKKKKKETESTALGRQIDVGQATLCTATSNLFALEFFSIFFFSSSVLFFSIQLRMS